MKTSRTIEPAMGGANPVEPEDRAALAARPQDDQLARQRARRRAIARSRAFTMIELLIVIEIIMVMAGMALPNIKTSRKQAHEASAVMSLRQLSDAQELYRPRQMPPMYAPSFERLRTEGLIDASLADSEGRTVIRRSGYRFIISGYPDENSYAFIATADVQGASGDRSFYVDQSGVIRMAQDASASALSPPIQ